MCGIAGIYHFNQPAGEADEQRIKNALKAIAHRGPDHQEVITNNRSCFGHVRLSIIDPSEAANQPMTDEHNRFTLIYNGELYNYKQIRNDLKTKGHSFRTSGDTEVVLKAFMEYGSACLQYFNGFFSFAIYDHVKQSFFAARDRFGIKPFYYSLDETGIVFGSELSAVSAITESRKLNPEALHLYFQLTYIPAPHSILEGILKLPAGYMIELSAQHSKVSSYYELGETDSFSAEFDEAAEIIRTEVERSVEMRMVADVPLGTFLSGGIDSSIISAVANKHHQNLETFSLGFSDSKFLDESDAAQQVADFIGSHHHRIMVNRGDLTDQLSPMLNQLDEPFGDSSALALYILSKETSKYVKVVLSGDGADELFGGYNKHRALARSENKSISNCLLKVASPLLSSDNSGRSDKISNRKRKISKYSQGLRHPLDQRYWNWLEWTPAETVSELLLSPRRDIEFENAVKGRISAENLNSILSTDIKVLLSGDMLTKADRMSMAHSLELRTPFLDHELVRKVNAMPFEYKCNSQQGKLLLRKAFAGQVPDFVFEKPKQGFEIPVEQWLRNELRSELEENSEKQLIEAQAVFNHNVLQQMIGEFLEKGQNKFASTLWCFIVFQRWWKRQFLLYSQESQ